MCGAWRSFGRRCREKDPVQTSSPSMTSKKGTGGPFPSPPFLSPVLFWVFFSMAETKMGQCLARD